MPSAPAEKMPRVSRGTCARLHNGTCFSPPPTGVSLDFRICQGLYIMRIPATWHVLFEDIHRGQQPERPEASHLTEVRCRGRNSDGASQTGRRRSSSEEAGFITA